MITTIIFGVLMLAGVVTFGALWNTRQKTKNRQKELQMESDAQLALEAQRFEKLREILTDGVLTDQPVALETLKPIAEVIASQMRSGEEIKRLETVHRLKMEEIQATNEPKLKALEAQNLSLEIYKIWDERVSEMWSGGPDLDVFIKGVEMITKTTQEFFPNLQLPAPDEKLLAEKNEGKK